MSEWLTRTQEQWLVYRLLIAKTVLTVLVTFCLGYQATMSNLKWSNMDNDERVLAVIAIIALVGDKLIAFFDKTAARLAKGELPVNDTQPPVK